MVYKRYIEHDRVIDHHNADETTTDDAYRYSYRKEGAPLLSEYFIKLCESVVPVPVWRQLEFLQRCTAHRHPSHCGYRISISLPSVSL
jgi:L-rhamnose isomerase